MRPIIRRRFAFTASLAAISLLASGCANQTTSYRTQRLGNSPMVITTDAYQRHLVMTPDREPGREGMWRTCAEASPDVFSVISGSGAMDLGFDSTSAAGVQAQARAAMSIAQSAATAERTQTINLLRESMFRTCERYMNGAIDRATFVVQAGRDWRAMIAILAIEQLTRTERPPSTVISAGGTSATVIGGEDAQRQLEAARRELEEAREAQTEANGMECPAPAAGAGAPGAGDAGADGEGAGGDGAGDAQAPDAAADGAGADGAGAGADAGAPAPAPAEGEVCDTKKTAIENANTRVQQAEAAVAAAQAKVNQAARSGSSTTPGTVEPGGGGGTLTAEALAIVAPVVRHIVDQAFDTDETQLFCLQILSRDSGFEAYPELLRECTRYLMTRVMSDQQRLIDRADLRELGVTRGIDIQTTRAFVAGFVRSLTDAEYAIEAPLIRARITIFCVGMNREACIRSIEGYRLDGWDSADLRDVIRQRITARSQARRQQ